MSTSNPSTQSNTNAQSGQSIQSAQGVGDNHGEQREQREQSSEREGVAGVTVIGIGQGSAASPTAQALQALARAEIVIGYFSYIDRIEQSWTTATRVASGNGQEANRARSALEEAAAGKSVALVCGGDAGVYGMAATVFRQRATGSKQLQSVRIKVVAGVTAAQAAAAAVGAPLGEDYCVISLSDIKRNSETILRRVQAALTADFTLVFYNPASPRRRDMLLRSLQLVADIRGADAPIALVSAVGTDQEVTGIYSADELIAAELSRRVDGEKQRGKKQYGAGEAVPHTIGMSTLLMVPSGEITVDHENLILYPSHG